VNAGHFGRGHWGGKNAVKSKGIRARWGPSAFDDGRGAGLTLIAEGKGSEAKEEVMHQAWGDSIPACDFVGDSPLRF